MRRNRGRCRKRPDAATATLREIASIPVSGDRIAADGDRRLRSSIGGDGDAIVGMIADRVADEGGSQRAAGHLDVCFQEAFREIAHQKSGDVAVFEHDRIVARQWIGVAVSFTGVFLIASHGEPARL